MRNKILLGIGLIILTALFTTCKMEEDVVPTYTVIYDSNYGEGNDGEGVMANSTFAYGQYNNLSYCAYENLGKEGYKFAGWAESPQGDIKYANGQKVETLTDKDSITLYARWGFRVYFYDDDKTTLLKSQIFVENGHAEDPVLTRDGYNFSGWYKEDNTQWNFEEDKVTGETRLYAKWNTSGGAGTATYYTVTFNTKGGSIISDVEVEAGKPLTKPSPDPTWADHSFVEWCTNEDCTIAYTFSNAVNRNFTLYAKWVTAYTVTFNKNNADSNSTEANPQVLAVVAPATNVGSLPNQPTRTGYNFDGWKTEGGSDFTASSPVTASITVYAQWTIVSYKVTFDSNGGNPTTPQIKTVTYPATSVGTGNWPDEPTLSGYTFAGWKDGSGAAFTATTTVTADITVYTQWSGKNSLVTFYKNNTDPGSNEATPQTKNVIFPVTTIDELPSNPTRTGYNFTGWNTQPSGGSTTVFTASTTVTANISVYAQWDPITYKVSYIANDGTGTMANSDHVYGISKTLTMNTFTRTNYNFIGWNTSPGGTGTSYGNGASVINLTTIANATVPLYAQWSGVSVTSVTLNKSTLTLTKGDSDSSLVATVNPSNALNKNVTWSSNNTSVAAVNSSTGVVTAIGAGTATITVTTADGGRTANCAITVKPKTIVYTAGYYYKDSNYQACYWVDNNGPIDLSGGAVASDVIVDNGKVYIFGNYLDGGYNNWACYWIDGVRTNLYLLANDAKGFGVSNNDVYVAYSNERDVGYYKNNREYKIVDTSDDKVVLGIAVSANDVVLYGYTVQSGTKYACYWKNENVTEPGPYSYTPGLIESEPVIVFKGFQDDHYYGMECLDMVISGNTKYGLFVETYHPPTIPGYYFIWKDNDSLPTEVTTSTGFAKVYRIAVFNSKIYLAGAVREGGPSGSDYPCYWADGVNKKLTDAASVNSIAAQGDVIYIAGTFTDGSISRPCYWINEERIPLPYQSSTYTNAITLVEER